jgi:hypothetical protein
MINEWLECKEFMRIANVSKSTVDRLKREIKKCEPTKLKLESGKQKLHRDLLRRFSTDYFIDFHDMVNYQLKLGKHINSMNSIWGLFLLSKEWNLFGTINYQQETAVKTCINRFKRIIEELKSIYPKIEGFYTTEINGNRKGYHLHFLIKTSKDEEKTIIDRLNKIKFPSNKTLDLKPYQQSKFGAGYFTKELENNPDGYGFI